MWFSKSCADIADERGAGGQPNAYHCCAETAHYTVPDWQCLHSGLGHGVRAQQDVFKAAHSGILCCLPH